MSTRRILKDRKKVLLWLIKQGKDVSGGMQKGVDEIDFIFEKLKDYKTPGEN